MPLNDYQCEACKEVFEVLDVRRSDIKETLTCEVCGKGIAKKIMGKTSFKLNGNCKNGLHWFNSLLHRTSVARELIALTSVVFVLDHPVLS